MNLRNRKLILVLRILFGLFMLFSGVGGLLGGQSMQGVPAYMVPYMQTLWATGLFQMIKITEVVSGLMLVFGFLPALAVIFLAPLGVGVVIFNARVAPAYVITGVIVCAFEIYFGYAYWDKYKALFDRKS